ncbi:MAG TPA: hypothetical protein DCS59_07335, partial [Eubacterium sp.]|nr:hypothetical protein [Eubacterium sp.]
CQVRKEAAISGSFYVPQISLFLRHAELPGGRFFILNTFRKAVGHTVFRSIQTAGGTGRKYAYGGI